MDKKDIDYILNLKKEIERDKLQKAKLEGALNSIFETMREEYGVGTLDEAKEKLEQLEAQLEKQEAKFIKRLKELKALVEKEDAFDEDDEDPFAEEDDDA